MKGDWSFAHILIGEGTDEYSSQEINDTIVVEHNWLTVKSEKGSRAMTITAKPSESSKKRALKIYGYFGSEYAVIDVRQGSK